MKFLLYLALIGAAAYAVAHYVPLETRQQSLAAIGLADFFQETLPAYLRSQLTIPENPVEKRQRLLSQLSGAIGNIETELEAVAPSAATGSTPSAGSTGSLQAGSGQAGAPPSKNTTAGTAGQASPPASPKTVKPITQSELRQRVEKTRELLDQSETVLEELEKANPQQGFIAKATERILDKILPPPQAAATIDGIGGDASGNPLCPQ